MSVVWKNIPIPTDVDFRIEAKVGVVTAESGSSFGLYWGGDKGDAYHAFYIRPDGSTRSIRRESKSDEYLSAWTAPIFRQLPPTYDIMIERQRDIVNLFVNEQRVNKIPFEQRFGTSMGFRLTGTISIDVHNLKVSEIYIADKR